MDEAPSRSLRARLAAYPGAAPERAQILELGEAFVGEAELKRAADTSFGLRDICQSFDLALWDPATEREVRWSELGALGGAASGAVG